MYPWYIWHALLLCVIKICGGYAPYPDYFHFEEHEHGHGGWTNIMDTHGEITKIYSTGTSGWSPTLVLTQLNPALLRRSGWGHCFQGNEDGNDSASGCELQSQRQRQQPAALSELAYHSHDPTSGPF